MKKILFIFLSIIILFLSFNYNIFNRNKNMNSNTYESYSEYLVLSKIYQEKYSSHTKYGLSIINIKENEREPNLINNFNNYHKEYKFNNYISQVGLQGYLFSIMYNKLHVSIKVMKIICCILLSVILVMICKMIYKKINKLLAIAFYLTFLLSPWIAAFSKNLYWVEFTWFLPLLFSLMLINNYDKKKIYVPLIFISMLIKCLCGYEFITTIMLSTISFLLIELSNEKSNKKEVIKTIFIVGITCLLAFMTALFVHASLRGNGNIFTGLESIYKEDIARRTINLPGSNQFKDSVYAESIQASIFQTVKKYFSWNTDIIFGINGKYFKPIIIVTIIILIINIFIKKKKECKKDFYMYLIFLFTTLSWFILGKSHSYIHIHMNYVLWYFGFIQICLYIILKIFKIKKLEGK